MVREELKLESITDDYYLCNICKKDDVMLIFEKVRLLFTECLVFKCGYPNEEIYMHYDYYTQGSMRKYHLYEILESNWIKELNEMNKIHPKHSNKLFKNEKHFIILFEDVVFECISNSYEVLNSTIIE